MNWKREKALSGSGAGVLAMWDVNLLKVIWRHTRHGAEVSAVSLDVSGRCLSAGIHAAGALRSVTRDLNGAEVCIWVRRAYYILS